jgi:hypothetical protein
VFVEPAPKSDYNPGHTLASSKISFDFVYGSVKSLLFNVAGKEWQVAKTRQQGAVKTPPNH